MKKALLCSFLVHFLYAFFIVILPAKLNGQQWTQVQRFGSTGGESVNGVAQDDAGNVYVTGYYTDVIDFGNGTGPLPAVGNQFGTNGFVAKFSAAGVCRWAIYLNCPDTARIQGVNIATNGTSVFVTGLFENCISVNGAPASEGHKYANGSTPDNGFGLKLDAATGSTQWATVFGGAASISALALCFDPAGNLYISGYFFTTPLNPLATFGSFTRKVNGGSGYDVFITRLDEATGTVSWVTSGGDANEGPTSDRNYHTFNKSGIVYVPELNSVVMTGSLYRGGANKNAIFTTTGSAASFSLFLEGEAILLLQLDISTGVPMNGFLVNGNFVTADAIVYDPFTKFLVFTGYFNKNSPLAFGNHPTLTDGDIYYAAFDPATNSFAWARSASCNDIAYVNAIAADGLGRIYLTGVYRAIMSAPSATGTISINSNKSNMFDEIFLLRLNSLAGYAEMLVSPQSNSGTTNISNSVSADNTGTVVLGGNFNGTTTFPPLPAITSAGFFNDALIVKYRNVASAPLPVRLHSFTAQRVNSDVIIAWHSEGEIDHDRFEIERSTDGRSFNTVGQRAALNAPGSGNYSWTDLSAAVQNAGKIFYRMKMISTTGQVTYSKIVIVYLDKNNTLVVVSMPNPFASQLSLSLNLPEKGRMKVSISDMSGRKISSCMVDVPAGFSTMAVKETGNLTKGIYIITIDYEGQKKVMRVVKQ